MSILNGNISYGAIHPEPSPFGVQLSAEKSIPLVGCMSLTFDETRTLCFALSSRGLVILDTSDRREPRELASLAEIKGGRSIAYDRRGFVYIAAREYGLYIVDVRTPDAPHLVTVYDTLELATSVALSGSLCLVANRHLGVELVDLSDPASPRFLSSYLCGEAQCVSVTGELALVGDWMNRRVYVTDISDPSAPRPVSSFEVDGYADGVVLCGGICYVATGHHSGRLKNRYAFDHTPFVTAEMLASGYGGGHGLEIFDLHDPRQPEYLSSVKLPPCFGAPDLWKVSVGGGRAYVSDSSNGLFIVNTEDLLHPFIEAHLRDIPKSIGYVARQQVQNRCAPITDCFVLDGLLYLAANETGIHILPYAAARDEMRAVYLAPYAALSSEEVLKVDGQVHNLVAYGDMILVAAGNGGLLALDRALCVKARLEVTALDVAISGELVLVAEGQAGVGCYTFDGATFSLLSKTKIENGARTVRQITALPGGILALQLGARMLAFLRLGDKGELALQTSFPVAGMIYYRNLATRALDGYFPYSSLREGVSFVDLSTLSIDKSLTLGYESCPFEDGVSVGEDGAVIISKNRYAYIQSPREITAPDFLKSEHAFRGIPILLGDKLLLLRRTYGEAQLYDLKDPKTPVYLGTASIPTPVSAIRVGNDLLVACGHGGIRRIRLS